MRKIEELVSSTLLRIYREVYLKQAVFFLLLLSVSTSAVYSQSTHSRKPIPKSFQLVVSERVPSGEGEFFNIESLLPADHVKDATVDYTEIIQMALNEHSKVKFPNFPVLVNEAGLTLASNSEVYFPSGSVINLKANANEHYEVLRLHDVSNVKLYNPVIIGDRDFHMSNEGEWGIGISIRASSSIEIYNPIVSDCWGDGIYLGHLRNVQVSDVKIFNAVIDNNRRNGISITSGNNVLVDGAIVSNTSGIPPQSGIVIEPSNDKAEFNGIVLQNVKTFNNEKSGIQIGGMEKLIGKTDKPINIDIINHEDQHSFDGMFMGRIMSPQNLPGPPLKGRVRIINPNWSKNGNSQFTKRNQYERGPTIQFSRLTPATQRDMWRQLKWDKDVEFPD